MEILAVSVFQVVEVTGIRREAVSMSLKRYGILPIGYGIQPRGRPVCLYELDRVQEWMGRRGLTGKLAPWTGPMFRARRKPAKRSFYLSQAQPFILLRDLCKATHQRRGVAVAFLEGQGVQPYLILWPKKGGPSMPAYLLSKVLHAYRYHSVSLSNIQASQVTDEDYSVRRVPSGS